MIDPDDLLAHADFLRNLVRSLVADHSNVDDIVQQTWLTALTHPPQDRSRLRSWLRIVTRNFARLARRDARRRRQLEERAQRASIAEATDVLAERERARQDVLRALSSLSEGYRVVVVLRFYDDLPPREIAVRLGLPVETVKTRLQRALQLMRRQLDATHGSDRNAWCLLLLPLLDSSPGSRPTIQRGSGRRAEPWFSAGRKTPAVVAAAVILVGVGAGVWKLTQDESEATRPIDVVGSARPGAGLDAAETARVNAMAGSSSATEDPLDARSHRESLRPDLGSLVVSIAWEDGTPAAGVSAAVVPAGDWVLVYGDLLDRVTGEDGILRVDNVIPGDVDVWIDRGLHARARIAPGTQTSCALMISPGIRVEGMITDEAGHPLSGADIVYCPSGLEDSPARLARSESDGSFRLRSISGGWLGARHPSFAPSTFRYLPARAVQTIPVHIQMPGPGGAIAGLIRSSDGSVVSGATIVLGDPAADLKKSARQLDPRRLWCESDAAGRFRANGLKPGPLRLHVRKDGFAPFEDLVNVTAGALRPVNVTLAHGGALVGMVLDQQGAGVPDVRLLVTAETPAGPIALLPGGTSGADGSFRFEHVPVGRAQVSAMGDNNEGAACAETVVVPGESVRWDVVLSRGREIRGALEDGSAAPLSGWLVTAMSVSDKSNLDRHMDDTAGLWIGECVSDAAGRFAIANCPDREHRIEVFEPDARTAQPCGVALSIRPSPESVLIRVRPEDRPSGFLTGQLLDSHEHPLADASLDVWWSDRWRWLTSVRVEADGRFRIGPFVAGRYDLSIDSSGVRTFLLRAVQVEAGEESDLGIVHLPASGSLLATVQSDERREARVVPWIEILDSRGELCRKPWLQEGVVRVESLPQGSYRLAVRGLQRLEVANDQVPFEVTAGVETRLDIPVRRGVARTIVCRGPDGSYWASWVRVVVRDERGRTIYSELVDRSQEGSNDVDEITTVACLAAGLYRVSATTDFGTEVEQSVGIRDLEPDPTPILLRLPAPPRTAQSR